MGASKDVPILIKSSLSSQILGIKLQMLFLCKVLRKKIERTVLFLYTTSQMVKSLVQ